MMAAVVAAVVLTSCATDPVLPDWATAPARPAAPAGLAPGGLGADLRLQRFAAGRPVTVTTRAGDRSFAVAVRAAVPGGLVGIRRVVDPGGEIAYLADLRHDVLLVDTLHPRVLADAGAVGLYVTSDTGQALPAGTWQIQVAGNDGPPSTTALIRHGDTDGTQVLDLAVWAVTDVDPEAVATAWRRQMDAVLRPHGLRIGALEVTAGGDDGAAWRTLGIDGLAEDVHQACDEAALATGASPRTAVVVLVERIGEGVVTADAGDAGRMAGHRAVASAGDRLALRAPDGEVDGFVVATPGTPVLGPASHACAAVAARGDAPARGTIALHEVLHLAGLTRHTTERDGHDFDLLPDTPECPADRFDHDHDGQVSRLECADRDAGNLMFWAAGGLQLSNDQVWRVRHHPLLRQPGGRARDQGPVPSGTFGPGGDRGPADVPGQ